MSKIAEYLAKIKESKRLILRTMGCEVEDLTNVNLEANEMFIVKFQTNIVFTKHEDYYIVTKSGIYTHDQYAKVNYLSNTYLPMLQDLCDGSAFDVLIKRATSHIRSVLPFLICVYNNVDYDIFISTSRGGKIQHIKILSIPKDSYPCGAEKGCGRGHTCPYNKKVADAFISQYLHPLIHALSVSQ